MDLPDLVQRLVVDPSEYIQGFQAATSALQSFQGMSNSAGQSMAAQFNASAKGMADAAAEASKLSNALAQLERVQKQINRQAATGDPFFQKMAAPLPLPPEMINPNPRIRPLRLGAAFEALQQAEDQQQANQARTMLRQQRRIQNDMESQVDTQHVRDMLWNAGFSSVKDIGGQNMLSRVQGHMDLDATKQKMKDDAKAVQDLQEAQDLAYVRRRVNLAGGVNVQDLMGNQKNDRIISMANRDEALAVQKKAIQDQHDLQEKMVGDADVAHLRAVMGGAGYSSVKDLTDSKKGADWDQRINRRLRMDKQPEMMGPADLGFKKSITPLASDYLVKGLEGLTSGFESVTSAPGKLLNYFKELPGKAAGFMKALPGKISDTLEEMPGKMDRFFGGIIKGAIEVGKNLPAHMFGFLKGAVSGAWNLGTGAVSGVSNFLKGIFNVDSVVGLIATLTGVKLAFWAIQTAVSAVTSSISTFVSKGMEVEKSRVEFGVLTQSMSRGRELFAQIQQMSLVSPFAVDELDRTGKLLLGMGVRASDLVPILGRLGDMAAGDSGKLHRLALVLGEVMEEGRLTGQRFRQFANLGVGLQDFADTLGVNAATVRSMIHANMLDANTVIATINRLTSETGRYGGMNKEVLATTEGQWSRLKNTISVVTGNAGAAFLGTSGMARGLSSIADWISSLEISAVHAAKVIGDIIGSVMLEFHHMFEGVKEAMDYLGNASKPLMQVIMPGGADAAAGARGMVDTIINLIELLGEAFTKVLAMIGKLVEDAIVWYANFSGTFMARRLNIQEVTEEEMNQTLRTVRPFTRSLMNTPHVWEGMMEHLQAGVNLSREKGPLPGVKAGPSYAPIPSFPGLSGEAQETVSKIQQAAGIMGAAGNMVRAGTGITTNEKLAEQLKRIDEGHFGSEAQQRWLGTMARGALGVGGMTGGLRQAAVGGLDSMFQNNQNDFVANLAFQAKNMLGGGAAQSITSIISGIAKLGLENLPDRIKKAGLGGLDERGFKFGRFQEFENLRKETEGAVSHYAPPKALGFATQEAQDAINQAMLDQKSTAERMVDTLTIANELSADQNKNIEETNKLLTDNPQIRALLAKLEGRGVN